MAGDLDGIFTKKKNKKTIGVCKRNNHQRSVLMRKLMLPKIIYSSLQGLSPSVKISIFSVCNDFRYWALPKFFGNEVSGYKIRDNFPSSIQKRNENPAILTENFHKLEKNVQVLITDFYIYLFFICFYTWFWVERRVVYPIENSF